MADSRHKRKQGPGGGSGGSAYKKSKGGSAGRWKTPHHKAKHAERVEMGTTMDVGDEGIWVTYARGMKAKAVREFKDLCDEYGREMYGIATSSTEDEALEDEDDEEDIEKAIQAELEGMKAKQKPTSRQVFTPVSAGVECLFFMKTMKPVEPGKFVLKICEDARNCPDPRKRKCKYINRLTPVFDTEKATEKGISKVARKVLAPWFDLNKGEIDDASDASSSQRDENAPNFTYAIRHNVRNHTTFKSEEVIKQVAGLIDQKHKVNLGNPDKVILVEIFQLFCGISVVDGKQWDELKRYNMNVLYSQGQQKQNGEPSSADAKPEEPTDKTAP